MENNIFDERSLKTAKAYNQNAKAYEQKFMHFGLYNDTFDEFLNLLPKSKCSILELGTGPGNVTRYMLERNPELSIVGIDISEGMIKLASSNAPTAQFMTMDVRKLTINQHFDAALSAFCIPYLAPEECSELIESIAKLLNNNGLLYLSFMDDDPLKSGYETTSFSNEMPVYIYYHTQEFIRDILDNNNFEVVFDTKKLYPEPDGTFLTDCILIAKKK